jgi:single-stranded DNA-binding protein
MTKRKQVYVEGRLQTRSYDDREGVKRYVTEVVARNIVLLGGGEDGSRVPESKAAKSGKASNRTSSRPRPEPEMPEMVDDSVAFQNGLAAPALVSAIMWPLPLVVLSSSGRGTRRDESTTL